MRKKKIKVISPSLFDQCSWYRAVGPWGEIKRRRDDLVIDFAQEIKVTRWDELVGFDALFFLRPFTQAHYQTIALAKALGLTVWVDYDDDFFVPEQCSWLAQNVLTTEWVKRSLLEADIITVSTASLAESFKTQVNREAAIIPNGMDMRVGDIMAPHSEKPRTKTVVWRGSETHDDDLLEISMPYVAVMNANPEWKSWFYWGYPKFISYFVEHMHARLPTALFLQKLAENCHNILMHPLNPTQFNRGKSNAAYLEGTMAGSLIIGRNLPEWINLPNCYTYRNSAGFSKVLRELMHMSEDDRIKSVFSGIKYIREKFDLSKLNSLREDLINIL